MTHSAEKDAPSARDVLAEHFVMWHDLNAPSEPGPRGEWRCQCGERFGFSDSAIDHQTRALAPAITAAKATAWSEGYRDGIHAGESGYVAGTWRRMGARTNPYRVLPPVIPQAQYDAAHDPGDYHCLNDPCEYHPFETRIRPLPTFPACPIPPASGDPQ